MKSRVTFLVSRRVKNRVRRGGNPLTPIRYPKGAFQSGKDWYRLACDTMKRPRGSQKRPGAESNSFKLSSQFGEGFGAGK